MRPAIVVIVTMLASVALAKPRVATEPAAPKSPPRWQTLPLPPAMPAANDHGTITIDGAQIYWASYGATTGEPVILLHGGLGNSDHWANQIPALVDAKQRILAIDSRGQGRSTRTNARISYERVGVTHQATQYADEALKAEQTKLEKGKSTSFVVLQLQSNLTAARSAEIRALADYNIALARLAQNEGSTLDRRQIQLNVK